MPATRWTAPWVACVLALGVFGCGAAPGNEPEATATAESAYTIVPPRLPPPWDLYPSGVETQWVDTNGAALQNIALIYHQGGDYVTYLGNLNVAIWDNLDLSGPSDACTYRVEVAPNKVVMGPTKTGPLLCNGTPYFTVILANGGFPEPAETDVLARAFRAALGDSLSNICLATNGHGTTAATTLFLDAAAFRANGPPDSLALRRPVTVGVTLTCLQ
jgi:hypothetical protein